MGQAFVAGDIDIEGDVEATANLARRVAQRVGSPRVLARFLTSVARLPAGPVRRRPFGPSRAAGARHSRARDATAVRSHYDVGNDFFRLFLDRRMIYSCAYFAEGVEDLDAAQEAKLELVCRKLRLRPGERFLDIGCGWGGLVCHAAARHGVHALGITLSEPQARHARERIAADGLGDRCRVEVADYRDLAAEAPFDKVASIGMVEHVGRARLATYFRVIAQVLKPGGLFLNHAIVSHEKERAPLTRVGARLLRRRTSFIQRFVFPDSELVGTTEVLAPGEWAGLEVRHLETLREHYARTLRLWVRRLEARRADAVAVAGEEVFRRWRLYMAASASLFSAGRLGVIQALWAKPGTDDGPGPPASDAGGTHDAGAGVAHV